MSSSATAERPESSSAPNAASGCPQCGSQESWGTASWCPACGYYPRLGSFAAATATPAPVAEVAPQDAPGGHADALRKLPPWAYLLAGGVLVIFVVSLVVRVVTAGHPVAHSLWSVTQLSVGGIAFLIAHVRAFQRATKKSDRLGFFDMVAHPLEIWRPSFLDLPASARRIYAGVWSFTAVFCAIAVIGGIRYSVLTDDWGFRERPKKNLMQQIKDKMLAKAKEAADEGADNLEDAVKDFAEGDDAAKKAAEKKRLAELERLSAECVVIGYNTDKKTGEIKELVLASLVDDQLQYVGTVTGGISPEVQKTLQSRLPKISQKQPFVKCGVTATWVKPVLTCRTAFKAWTGKKQMEKPVFKELLAEVK